MSYSQRTKVQYADTFNLDAFSRLRISDTVQIWESKVVNGQDWGPDIITMILNPDGNSGAIYGSAYCSLRIEAGASGGATASTVIRESPYHLPHQAGRSSICNFAFGNFYIDYANSEVIKRIGLFHDASFDFENPALDGFYFENNGTIQDVRFVISYNGTETYSFGQGGWSNLDFDPNNIDWEMPQIGWIDYDWGIGRVRFGLVIEGIPIKFGDFSLANDPYGVNPSTTLTTCLRPNQKFRQEITLQAGGPITADEDFISFSQSYSIEGSKSSIYKTFSWSNFIGVTGASVGYPTGVIGFQLPVKSNGATGLPEGPYWNFAELDSVSFVKDDMTDGPSILQIYDVPTVKFSNLGFTAQASYNLNGAGGTASSLLFYSEFNPDFNGQDINLMASYVMTDNIQTIPISKSINRPGYVQTDYGNTPGTYASSIWLVVVAPNVTDNHWVTANWKCIL